MPPSRLAITLLLPFALAAGCTPPAPPSAPPTSKLLAPAPPRPPSFADRAPAHTRILGTFDLHGWDLGPLIPPPFNAFTSRAAGCGIDLTHERITLDLAIAEPAGLRAELHGAVTVTKVACVLGLPPGAPEGASRAPVAVASMADGGVLVATPSAMADGPGAPIALQTLFFSGPPPAHSKIVARLGPPDAPLDAQISDGPTGTFQLGFASREQAEAASDVLMRQRAIVQKSGDASLDALDIKVDHQTLILGLHEWTFGAALSIRKNMLGSTKLPAGSMLPGLVVGDHLLILKGEVGRAVKRGDIVVFPYPKDPKATFAKRVIAIGGDHLEILGHALRINGVAVPTVQTTGTLVLPKIAAPAEVWTETLDGRSYSILHNEPEPVDPEPIDVKVPPGSVYVLGDNRENSLDSRQFGDVQLGSIEGRVIAVWASFDELGMPRWDRTGLVVR